MDKLNPATPTKKTEENKKRFPQSSSFFTSVNSSPVNSFFPSVNQPPPPPFFQPSLNIGPVDDPYEKEAEAMEDKIVGMSEKVPTESKPVTTNIQKKIARDEEEILQRCAACEEESPIQRSPESGERSEAEVPSLVHEAINSSGAPLEPGTRSFFEPRFGHDFSNVSVHTDSLAGASAKSINAKAYTHQNNIVFGAGQYQPETETGKKLLAHELTHVIQQQQTTNNIQRDKDEDLLKNYEATIPNASGSTALYQELTGFLKGRFKGTQWEKSLASGLYIILAGDLVVMTGAGETLGHFQIKPGITIPASYGYYLADGNTQWQFSKKLFQSITGAGDYHFFDILRPQGDSTFIENWIEPSSLDQYKSIFADRNSSFAILVIAPIPEPTNDKTVKQNTLPDWAKTKLNDVMASLKKASAKAKAAQTEDGTTDQRSIDKEIPDSLDPWKTDDDGTVHVFVRVADLKKTILIKDGETNEDIEKEVRQKASELNDKRNATLSTKTQDGAKKTGFIADKDPAAEKELPGSGKNPNLKSERDKIDKAQNKANVPAFGAKIDNFGADITVVGGNNRLDMVLDYGIAGPTLMDQVQANLEGMEFRYLWEIYDVTNVKTQDQEKLKTKAAGTGETPTSGEATELKRDFKNIGKDFYADLTDMSDDPAIWHDRSAELALMAVSSIVQGVGALIGSFISIVTKPLNEKNIGWSREGDFVVRCIATHPFSDDDKYIRASSVAVQPIRVKNITSRAIDEINKPEQVLATLRKQLLTTKQGTPEYDELDKKIKALEASLAQSATDFVTSQTKSVEEQLALAQEIVDWTEQGKPDNKLSPAARLLRVNLELKNLEIYKFRDSLKDQLEPQKKLQQFGDKNLGEIQHPYKPRVVLASEENGKVFSMVIMLGEKTDSTETNRQYRLVDLTSPATQDYYDGASSKSGIDGHNEAITKAFNNFAENANYGRGTIAIRMPDDMQPKGLNIPSLIVSQPGKDKRMMTRLADLAKAAEVAALVVGGPAGMAIGIVGGLASAAVTIDSMIKRSHAGKFEWDLQTVSDIFSIVAGVAPIGAFIKPLKNGAHLIGMAQWGKSAIVIPFDLFKQLQEIDDNTDKTIAPGEKAAKKAEAILSAVKSGIITFATTPQLSELTEKPSEPQKSGSEPGTTPIETEGATGDTPGAVKDNVPAPPADTIKPADVVDHSAAKPPAETHDTVKPAEPQKPLSDPHATNKPASSEDKAPEKNSPDKPDVKPVHETTDPAKSPKEENAPAKGEKVHGKEVLAEEPAADGHKVKVTEEGILKCSDCNLLRREYAKELANASKDPVLAELNKALDEADKLADPAEKAKVGAEIEAKLKDVRNDRLEGLQKRYGFSDETLGHLRENQAKPESVEKLLQAGVNEQNIAIYSMDPRGVDIMAGLIAGKVSLGVAEKILTSASKNHTLGELGVLIGEGRLDNPTKVSELLDKITSGDKGSRNELGIAAESAAEGNHVKLGTQGDLVFEGKPGDPNPDRQVLQVKQVNAGKESYPGNAFGVNLHDAQLQLQGLSTAGKPKVDELPQSGYKRVADIKIDNPANSLYEADRPALTEAIKATLGDNEVKSQSPVKGVIGSEPVVQQVVVRNKNGALKFDAPDFK